MCRIIYKGKNIKNISITNAWEGPEMTNNELELLSLIRENDNPDQALLTAIDIILLTLVQHESSQSQASACLQAQA